MDNAPAFGLATKDQLERAVRIIVFAPQTPAAEHHDMPGVQEIIFDVRESEPPHFLPTCVFAMVSITHRLPAASDLSAGDELEFVRADVAVHKSVDIPAVPRCDLRIHDGANFRLRVRRLRDVREKGEQQKRYDELLHLILDVLPFNAPKCNGAWSLSRAAMFPRIILTSAPPPFT